MKKFLPVPATIMPYLMILAYFFNRRPFRLYVHITMRMAFILSVVFSLIFIVKNSNKSAKELLKNVFLIKVIQIPAYIFWLWFGYAGTLFGAVPDLLWIILIAVFSGGIMGVFVLIKAIKDKSITNGLILVIATICQLLFVADTISLFIVWVLSKESRSLGKKIIKAVSILLAVILFCAIVFSFFMIIYANDYAKHEIYREDSSDGEYVFVLYQVGSPKWPFGPVKAHIRVYNQSDKIIDRKEFWVNNDGTRLTEFNIKEIRWYDTEIEVDIKGYDDKFSTTYVLNWG